MNIILIIIIFLIGFIAGALVMLHYATPKSYEVKNTKFGMSKKI